MPSFLEDLRLSRQVGPSLERIHSPQERVKTGFHELDRALGGGIPAPNLVVLGAKPKCGKSSLLLQMLVHVVTHGGYGYLVDRENGLDRLLKRLLSAQSGTDATTLGTGQFVPTEPWRSAERLVREGSLGQRLFVETERAFDWRLLERRIGEIANLAKEDENAPLMVVLDSLQKLPMNLQDRRSGIDGWMRSLEYIRAKHRTVIVLASELKRPPQGAAYKPSEISLKESGDIEYSADLVLTLDRPEDREDDFVTDRPPQPATMRILFNRDGQTGRVADYRLVYPYHRVEEQARPHYEGIRKVHLAAVAPIRPGLEAGSQEDS